MEEVSPVNEQFEREYKRCRPAMTRTARRVAGKDLASMAVSEAAAKLWVIADKIDYLNPNRVMGLFCTTARRAAIDAKRHEDHVNNDDKMWAELNPPLTRNEQSVERTIAVHRALSMIDPLESWIAWNMYALEFSPKEILEELAKDGVVWSLDHFYRFLNKRVKPNLRDALLRVGADNL